MLEAKRIRQPSPYITGSGRHACFLASSAINLTRPVNQRLASCDFQFKRYQVDDKSIGVTLWCVELMLYHPVFPGIRDTVWRDTAGSERFSAMTSSYFRGAHGIILGADYIPEKELSSFLL
eukprot:64832-Pelagomonas_calceolata.AAC.2